MLLDGLRFTPQLTERQEEARDGLEITAAEKFTAAVGHLNIMSIVPKFPRVSKLKQCAWSSWCFWMPALDDSLYSCPGS